ncbi:MAG: hypothetical protein HY664_03080 [Chloroflexi bacterium]|nr:hypothetical protein [Chloroflexota bacterium]
MTSASFTFSLLQNGLDSFFHALEHLALVKDNEDDRSESDSRFYDAHYSPPAHYNHKWAILHLVQAIELLLKESLSRISPDLIFYTSGKQRSVDLTEAAKRLRQQSPHTLLDGEMDVLAQALFLRNQIQHFSFAFSRIQCDAIVRDLLSFLRRYCYRELGVDVVEYFGWDPRKEDFREFVSTVLQQFAPNERKSQSDRQYLKDWSANNPGVGLHLCIACGLRSVAEPEYRCLVCLYEWGKETTEVIEELKSLTQTYRLLRSLEEETNDPLH